MDYHVFFIDRREGVIDEEVFIRDDLIKLLDSVKSRVMHDPDLLHDCVGLNIRPVH